MRIRLDGESTAHDVAREEGFRAGVNTGPFGRIQTAEQTEVFVGKGRQAEEHDGQEFADRFWERNRGQGFGCDRGRSVATALALARM